jgi:PEP-CTERM motif-containing protein
MSLRKLRFILMIAFVSLPTPLTVKETTADTVVPNSVAAIEANDTTRHPFNIGSGASQRYQQVYDASQFSGPQLITGIRFRPEAEVGFGGAFSSTLPSIQINLSTTGRAVDALSATFADNVGLDDVIVFGPGALTLSSLFSGPPGGPKAFDITIPLTTSFAYDPSRGNLLLDVRNFGGGFTTDFDSEFSLVAPDSISRVRTGLGNVNSPTADVIDSSGLVTLFTTGSTSVPEPGALLLASSGLAALAGIAWRQRRRT